MSADIVAPVGCLTCGVSRRLHDADHPYEAPDMRTVLQRAIALKRCTHWVGDEDRYCGSQIGVRPFIQGPRCKLHDPNVLKAGAQ